MGPVMVLLRKVKAHATLTDVADRITTWFVFDRSGNTAAGAAANVALAVHLRFDVAFGCVERIDKVVIMAAKWVGHRAAVTKVHNEARDTQAAKPPARRQSHRVQVHSLQISVAMFTARTIHSASCVRPTAVGARDVEALLRAVHGGWRLFALVTLLPGPVTFC